MGDTNHPAATAVTSESDYSTAQSKDDGSNGAAAFHNQYDQAFQPNYRNTPSYGQQQGFDMGAMGAALPHVQHSGIIAPQAIYQMQQQGYTGVAMDPPGAGRVPTQQFMHPRYFVPQMSGRHAMPPIQTHGQYGNMNPYGMGVSPHSPQIMDPRFAHNVPFGGMSPMAGEAPNLMRQAPEPAPVPSYPRGPPRKPKQSGHALWVGNLPPAATVTDLKDHFSREATKEIESLFLISKSNCAFVNYRSEAACVAAMNRFHDSRFHGVRLVCRLRRGSAASISGTQAAEAHPAAEAPSGVVATDATIGGPEDADSPTIVGGSHFAETGEKSGASTGANFVTQRERVPEKYFVVKSLTVQDMESSVRNGIWATQNHNESMLNQAYEDADNVYLIFSANKSGEYFGYARMTSPIAGQPVNLNTGKDSTESPPAGIPQAIQTPATATAPKGRIIDDSARGTIFWEAEQSEDEEIDTVEGNKDKEGFESTPGSNWGRQFSVEWISTARLPFYRTRGLRNPWNSNREVKIARDGTELEPSVGRRLVQMFHQSPQGYATG